MTVSNSIDLSNNNFPSSIFELKKTFVGLSDFSLWEARQKELVKEFKNSEQVMLLGIEFQPVITLGIRAVKENQYTADSSSASVIDRAKLPIFPTDRGGLATVHSPGQLVIYPMIDLKFHKLGIKKFIDLLFEASSNVLNLYEISHHYDQERPGLYTDKGKIAFVGIKVDQGVVRHGISINVKNDLSLFDAIVSCGIKCQSHDKIENHLGKQTLSLENLFEQWTKEFAKVLATSMRMINE